MGYREKYRGEVQWRSTEEKYRGEAKSAKRKRHTYMT
jgi:hypothetical protein